MSVATAAPELLDGATLRSTFTAAAQHLRESAAAVDAINVYPVPDGDTGSNMSATLREAVARTESLGERPGVTEVLETIARGALYGARGNSGVILSQALRGFARGVGETERLDARRLADGLEAAAEQAYRAVGDPQEGTMLTVLREAGAAAMAHAERMPERGAGHGCIGVLGVAVAAAETAEAETINQLDSLREAGVTDAGGEGVCVILRGMLGSLRGEMPAVRTAEKGELLARAAEHADDEFGFCTEFLVEAAEGALVDAEQVRKLVEAGENRSALVVGDATLIRVHVHTMDPQGLIDSVEALGRVSRVKVEDMTAQNARFRVRGSGASAKVGLLAMSRGAGLDAVFEGLGAAVSDLGTIEKPPAGEIARAADSLRVPDVVVLPNHRNVRMAAEQAKELAKCTLHVVPTTSLPQGIAAALSFDAEAPVAETLKAMTEAAEGVRTIEITRAGATRSIEGVAVREGDAIALVDGKLVASVRDPEEALLVALARDPIVRGALITVYGGAELEPGELERACAAIEQAHPGVEVEAVEGQQPLYLFIASVE